MCRSYLRLVLRRTLTDPPVAHELYEEANEPKTFMLVEGGGHGDEIMVRSPEYAKVLEAFLKQLKAG